MTYKCCSHIIETLQNIETNDTILYRKGKMLPSSLIIHNEESGSRTIISNNEYCNLKLINYLFILITIKSLTDLSCEEFVQVFTKINKNNQWWVHFEGRNIDQTIEQIDWLNEKASEEHWRHNLIISVEIEKPERENIDLLIERV